MDASSGLSNTTLDHRRSSTIPTNQYVDGQSHFNSFAEGWLESPQKNIDFGSPQNAPPRGLHHLPDDQTSSYPLNYPIEIGSTLNLPQNLPFQHSLSSQQHMFPQVNQSPKPDCVFGQPPNGERSIRSGEFQTLPTTNQSAASAISHQNDSSAVVTYDRGNLGARPLSTLHDGPSMSQDQMLASTKRLQHLDPRSFTVSDINELLKVIEVSNQYGKEIERSVEELATLLKKKTIECEGLRKLAAENHSALAEAVKNEYNSRVRIETKQANEIRDLQNKIATMRSEKDDLQREVETLRMMVAQLKATPTPLSEREIHEGSLFNRIAKGVEKKSGTEEQLLTTWNMPRPSQLTPSQRELINFVGNLSAEVARNLQSAGSFDFLTVLCQRLCTPTNANGDVYPDIGVTLGELLRELRLDIASGSVGLGSQSQGKGVSADSFLAAATGNSSRLSIAQQSASATIPLVKKSARMRVIDLFLANNPQDYSQPNKVTELNRMLEENEGKEEELYTRLLEHYRKKDPTGSFLNRIPPSNYVYQPPQTPHNTLNASPSQPFRPLPYSTAGTSGIESESELHVRVALMYKKYNPSKLHTKEYKELVAKYPPETLLKALIQRYGPEPTPSERRQLVRMISENSD